MSDQISEPIYLVAKNVIQQANQFNQQTTNQFANVHILNDLDNIPAQFILPNKLQPKICSTIELKPALPQRPIKRTIKFTTRERTINQINNLKQQTSGLIDYLKDFFSLSTELTFRLIILFVIYLSIIYNLYRSLASLYLIESNFRSTYHYLTPSKRTFYSIFMFIAILFDCYGVYTLLKKNIVHIFFYAICLTLFSLLILILFGFLSSISVTLSLFIASLCYLFTYVEYRQCHETTGVCQQCVHHHHQMNHVV